MSQDSFRNESSQTFEGVLLLCAILIRFRKDSFLFIRGFPLLLRVHNRLTSDNPATALKFKKGTEGTPWVDVVEPGSCLFHGDNRSAGDEPLGSRGNAKFVQLQHYYVDPALRKFAPPVLVFEQTEHAGIRRGYRRFCGFGVPVRHSLATQKEKNGYFTNLVIELALFRLEEEKELFEWKWIDVRRDGSLDGSPQVSHGHRA